MGIWSKFTLKSLFLTSDRFSKMIKCHFMQSLAPHWQPTQALPSLPITTLYNQKSHCFSRSTFCVVDGTHAL